MGTVPAVGLSGLRRVEARIDSTAHQLASAGDITTPDQVVLSDAMLALIAARIEFASAAVVIRTDDEMQRTLLDLLG